MRSYLVMMAVHPRARGEHFDSIRDNRCPIGSSPRTRGTYFWPSTSTPQQRFIPAHAGNITGGDKKPPSPPVHPRARGEHLGPAHAFVLDVGSSPRTRGTSPRTRGTCQETRFIPAHAGNIRSHYAVTVSTAVHPRARGEHKGKGKCALSKPGSSPRTRGTFRVAEDFPSRPRFIPAHAGNIAAYGRPAAWIAVHPRARGEHTSHNLLFYMTKISSKNSTDFFGWIRHSRGERF